MELSQKKKYINIGAAVAAGLIIRSALHPAGSLTAEGVNALSICIPVIYLWITTATDWPSLAALMLISAAGVYDSVSQVSAASFGNQNWMFTLVCMLFSCILVDNGIIGRCADFFMSRRISRHRPYMFLFMFFLSMTLVVSFLEKIAVTFAACGLAGETARRLDLNEKSEYRSALFLGVLWVCSLGGNATPVSHVIPAMMMNLIDADISIIKWSAVGMIINIIMLAVLMLVIVFIWKPAERDGIDKDLFADEYVSEYGPMSRREKLTVCALAAVISLWLLPQLLPAGVLPHMTGFLSSIGSTGPVIIGIVALCIIDADGEPAADIGSAMRGIPVRLLVFQAGIYMISDVTVSEKTGIKGCIHELLYPHVSHLPDFVIFAVIFVIALVITNFTSNLIAAVLSAQLLLAIFADGSYSMFAMVLMMSYAASLAVLTPSASPAAAIAYSEGNADIRSVWKYAAMMTAMMAVLLITAAYPMLKLL